MWQDSKFLYGFFSLFPNQNERAILAQVCQKWREVLYQPVFWRDVRPVIHCRAIRSWSTSVASYCGNTSSTATSSASNQSITNSSFSNNERSTTCEVNSNTTTTNNAADMQQTTASEAVVTSPASTTGNNITYIIYILYHSLAPPAACRQMRIGELYFIYFFSQIVLFLGNFLRNS